MVSAYINIDEATKGKLVYRIIPFHRLLEIFERSELTFIKPRLWDDPFENFFFNQLVDIGEGPIKFKDFGEPIAGLCFTFNDDSDFSWRVYAPNKDGVQISVRINELYDSVNEYLAHEETGQIKCGKVEYVPFKKIKKNYENPSSLKKRFYPLEILGLYSLFIKREEFKHEKEIRVLVTHTNLLEKTIKTFSVPVNPLQLILSIKFDPRITKRDYLKFRKQIKDMGYSGKIVHSRLYQIPRFKINLNGVIKPYENF